MNCVTCLGGGCSDGETSDVWDLEMYDLLHFVVPTQMISGMERRIWVVDGHCH